MIDKKSPISAPQSQVLTATVWNTAVIVSALGYFVDIYDLILFGIVRTASLQSLGYQGADLTEKGVLLMNLQMGGMLLGGILWGVMGDKRGRLSVLFGSIFIYSAANLLNAFVTDIYQYGALRFLAGLGLAGELGAGITLVNESMSRERRGYGTMVVVVFGALGAVVASLFGEYFRWEVAYITGGLMGFLLLVLRVSTYESDMFARSKEEGEVVRGDFLSIFRHRGRALKYLRCVLIGLPIWYCVGILIVLSPELTAQMGLTEPVKVSRAILYCYLGLSAGDMASGLLSQLMRSRKRVIWLYLGMTFAAVLLFLLSRGYGSAAFYTISFLIGFSAGYWAIFVTVASEQFGTNIRATVTTTVPNFVRGAVIPLTLSFMALQPLLGVIYAALVVGIGCLLLAAWALWGLPDTFGKDLDYQE